MPPASSLRSVEPREEPAGASNAQQPQVLDQQPQVLDQQPQVLDQKPQVVSATPGRHVIGEASGREVLAQMRQLAKDAELNYRAHPRRERRAPTGRRWRRALWVGVCLFVAASAAASIILLLQSGRL